MPPCVDPPAAELTLTLTVDSPTAAVGDTVTYTITIGNAGSLPASGVTVDDVLGGDAGYLVEDGTAGTADTFVGAPVATITRVLAGHYRWSYPVVSPGDNDVVRFSAVIRLPGSAASATPGVVVLSSTASTTGVPAASVTTTVSLPAGVGGGAGTPPTGSGPSALAGLLALGGLGPILLTAIMRRREELAAGGVARRPARSR